MTDDERDEMLIRVDEKVNTLHDEMRQVKKCLSNLSTDTTRAKAGLFVLLALGGIVTGLLTTTNVIRGIWPWG